MTGIRIEVEGTFNMFPPTQVVTIGRSADANVVINDKTVSRIHAELVFDPNEAAWIFTDKGSANGSYIDGVEIITQKLSLPVTIQIGSFEEPHFLDLRAVDLTPPAAPVPVVEPPVVAEPIVEVAVAPEPEVVVAVDSFADDVESCGYCGKGVRREFGPRCPSCRTFIHSNCWNELQGCITPGCSLSPSPIQSW